MTRLFAKKPCSFGGKQYLVGEEIPASAVLNPKRQEQLGTIAITHEEDVDVENVTAQVGVVKFAIPIHAADEGDLILEVTNEELVIFTDILQSDVKTTEDKQKVSAMIQNIESEDLLIMLDALDGRKHVREEAKERAKALQEASADTEDKTEDEAEPKELGGGE